MRVADDPVCSCMVQYSKKNDDWTVWYNQTGMNKTCCDNPKNTWND